MSTKTFKAQQAATLLNMSNDMLRRTVIESGINVLRQETGPQTRLYSVENLYDLAAFRRSKTESRTKRQVVCTVYAPKGGVGKTTLSANLACILALMGLKVLAIDLDFQANLTLSYGYDSELAPEDAAAKGEPREKCVEYHFGHLVKGFDGDPIPFTKVIKKPFGENGPHLIPSDVLLDRLDSHLIVEAITTNGADLTFARMFAEGRKPGGDFADYDVILFDAAPAKNKMTRNALMASDFCIAPISLEKYSTKSISYLASVLGEMNENAGRCPNLVIVANFYDHARPRVLDQMAVIRNNYGQAWLDAVIRRSEDFPRTLSTDEHEMPLSLLKPSSSGAADLRAVADSLMKRMGVIG